MSIRRVATVLIGVLVGCASEAGESNTIPWWTAPDWPKPTSEQIDFIEETMGMEMVRQDDAQGAVTLFFSDDVSHGWGSGISCSPHASASGTNDRVIAHEIGHVFGLEHVDDPDNLMHPTVDGGTDLSDAQSTQIRREAWNLERCK